MRFLKDKPKPTPKPKKETITMFIGDIDEIKRLKELLDQQMMKRNQLQLQIDQAHSEVITTRNKLTALGASFKSPQKTS